MALSKLEPDKERVMNIALRMREIIETTWLRDPVLNEVEGEEFKRLEKEIQNMGLCVSWETRLNLDNPSSPKLEADINVLIPKNTTMH